MNTLLQLNIVCSDTDTDPDTDQDTDPNADINKRCNNNLWFQEILPKKDWLCMEHSGVY